MLYIYIDFKGKYSEKLYLRVGLSGRCVGRQLNMITTTSDSSLNIRLTLADAMLLEETKSGKHIRKDVHLDTVGKYIFNALFYFYFRIKNIVRE